MIEKNENSAAVAKEQPEEQPSAKEVRSQQSPKKNDGIPAASFDSKATVAGKAGKATVAGVTGKTAVASVAGKAGVAGKTAVASVAGKAGVAGKTAVASVAGKAGVAGKAAVASVAGKQAPAETKEVKKPIIKSSKPKPAKTAKQVKTVKSTKAKFPPVIGIMTVGRRKTAVAQVTLKKGKQKVIQVNRMDLDQYFPHLEHQLAVKKPLALTLETLKRENDFVILLDIRGGGKSAQAQSASLAIARALDKEYPDIRPVLRKASLLTRDSRMVERKKYGRHKARRSTQFSKR